VRDVWFGLGLLVAVALTVLAAYDGWTGFITVPLIVITLGIAFAWLASQADWLRKS
jgi:hypothetical protein